MKSKSDQKPASLSKRVQTIYREYPRQYWVLVLGTFIDRLGGALLFPFFTLYLTRKFGIGMTQVGFIFGIFAISSVVGSMVGGALTDRMGRKGMLLFGLVMSGLSSLLMGVVDSLSLFFVVILLVGVLSETGGPAQQAMVADLLPEEKRAQGFGILRVVVNLAVTVGPVLGGLLASRSYMLLFASDAATSLITAGIAFVALKESKRPRPEGEPAQSMAQTFKGYGLVLRDYAYLWFLLASLISVIVYMQMNTSLAVFLRDVHGVTEQGFGYILSLNAIMVVLFQFAITRRITRFRPLIVMTVGTLFYAVGFALYGFVSIYPFFLLAMAVITIGEMLVSPVGQAIVARFAPEEMRGRYMAMYGFSWVIPAAIGPLMAGLVMDNLNPNWVWYGAGILGLVAAAAYYSLEVRVGRSKWAAIDERLRILELLEEGKISAEQAHQKLEGVTEGVWARLTPPVEQAERRKLRIRVSDQTSGVMKVDLHLPMGLVNTVLYLGGRLSTDLEKYDPQHIQELIDRSAEQQAPQQLDVDGERLEVSLE